MFNFQRWKVWRFLRHLHRRWAGNEEKESKMAPAEAVLPLPQKKRKEKKVKVKALERSHKPWAKLPRPAGKAAITGFIAKTKRDGNSVPPEGVEGFRQAEDFFNLLPIDEYIPPNFDKKCFKAVIIFGFLRPTIRYKPINFNYVPEEDIVKRVVRKGYRAEVVKKILEWLRKEQLVINSHVSSFGSVTLSLNIKPWSISGVEAKKICQACTSALAKLRAAR